MIASAASSQWSAASAAIASGRPAIRRSTGRGSMITPVENGRIAPASTPSNRAAASQVLRAAASPGTPVPALALPVLMTNARIDPPARCSRHTWTGAAANRLRVKTPATLAPAASRITSRSLRFALRMPASVQPSSTPATGSSSSRRGGVRLTGMAHATDQKARTLPHARTPAVRGRSRRGRSPLLQLNLQWCHGRLATRACHDTACTSCRIRTGTDRCGRSCR